MTSSRPPTSSHLTVGTDGVPMAVAARFSDHFTAAFRSSAVMTEGSVACAAAWAASARVSRAIAPDVAAAASFKSPSVIKPPPPPPFVT